MRLRGICLAMVGLSISGCGIQAFVAPKAQPVITTNIPLQADGQQQALVSLATTAERRNIFFNPNKGRACFEAPPDAAEAISSSFSGAIQAAAGTNATVAASLGTNFATAIASLSKRSQGVILFRDAAFNLCLRFFNGTITEAEYNEEYKKLLGDVIPLIQAEINVTNGKIGPDTTITTSPVISSSATVNPTGGTAGDGSSSVQVSSGGGQKNGDAKKDGNASSAGESAAIATAAVVGTAGGTDEQVDAASQAAMQTTDNAVKKGAAPSAAASTAAGAASSAPFLSTPDKAKKAESAAQKAVDTVLGKKKAAPSVNSIKEDTLQIYQNIAQ